MIIHVKAKPNSSEEKVEKISNNEYEINVKEKAEQGKANNRIINILSKKFNVSAKNIKIKNPASRKKIVEIEQQ